jgi:hypothetical protein
MWRHYAQGVLTFLHDLVISRPERVALRNFRSRNPEIADSWSSRVCDEGDRFVICVFYGACRPAQYRFYSVSRDYRRVEELNDDSAYRPKGWR